MGPEHAVDTKRCFVCGHTGSPTKQLTEVTKMLTAHKSCFVGHQCYTVLNTGREDESPANNGKWKYNWQGDMRLYVKPEFAAAVTVLLAKRDAVIQPPPNFNDEMLKRPRGVAQEGVAAFGQAAMLC